mgnify:CR=1 FL=1
MSAEDGDDYFLTDFPIDSIDDDEFRHEEYVDTLEKIVRSAESPWNIGVFGEWGSGKTSIIEMLYSRFQKSDNDFVCVQFDAWKHAEDSIRTDLLLNLDRAIGESAGKTVDGTPGVLGEDKITRKLYDVEEEDDGEDLSAWEEARRIYEVSPLVGGGTLLILAIILIGAFINALTILGLLQIGDTTLSSLNSILSAFLFPLFVSVFVFMAGEVRKATSSLRRKHPRKEWSGAYEQLFEEILAELDSERVVISIDNLDRCESETVYDVLVSLKTFLEHDDCIYLIPCDDKALQSHIESIDEEGEYFGQQTNGQEFLRKFFQTHLRIPRFIPEDIEEYAEIQNQELSQPFDQDVIDVITKAYIKNPRRIKQSLNRMATLRMLAEQMETEDYLDSGTLTDNLAFLAKITVLEEDFPQFYSQLQDDHRLLEDVNEYFRGNLEGDKEPRIEKQLHGDEQSQTVETGLEEFLRSTLPYTVDNPKPFLKLGEPAYASEIEDTGGFIQNLRASQVSNVTDELESITAENQDIQPYVDAIESALDEYYTSGRTGALISTINTTVQVYDSFDNQKTLIAEVLGEKLVLGQTTRFYQDVNPDDFFPVVTDIPEDNRTTVFKRFAKSAVSDDGLRENTLEAFTENADQVPREAAKQLSQSLLELNGNEFTEALTILDYSQESRQLPTPELLERAASQVTWSSRQNQFSATDHYLAFDNEAKPRSRKHYVNRLLEVERNVDNENNERNQYFHRLSDELKNLSGQVDREVGPRLFDKLKEAYSSNHGSRIQLIKHAITFYPSYDPKTREEFQTWVANNMNRHNQNQVIQIVNHAIEEKVQILNHKQTVESILSKIPDNLSKSDFIKDTLIPAIPRDQDQQIISLLQRLSQNNNHPENVLAAEIYAEHPDRLDEARESVLERCHEQFDTANSAQQNTAYLMPEVEIYDRLSDSEKEGFINNFTSLLSGDPNDHQAFRDIWDQIEVKLNSDRRTSVAREVRDRLEQEIRSNNVQVNQLFPLIDVFGDLTESDNVDQDDGEWVVERLSTLFEGNDIHNNRVPDLLDKISGFGRYYGQEKTLLSRTRSLVSNQGGSDIHQSAERLLEQFEQTDDLPEDKIKEAKSEVNQ